PLTTDNYAGHQIRQICSFCECRRTGFAVAVGRLSSPAGHQSAGVRLAHHGHVDASLFATVAVRHAATKDAGPAVDGPISEDAGAVCVLLRMSASARVHLV